MPIQRFFKTLCLMSVLVMLAACSGTSSTPITPTSAIEARLQSFTPIPTAELRASATPTLPPAPTSTPVPTITDTSSPTEIPTLAPATSTDAPTSIPPTAQESIVSTVVPPNTAVPAAMPTLARVDHYVLGRPIARAANLVDWVDRTYPYGGTQFGVREVHTGVEFVNVRHTPVLAAASGKVLYAGTDESKLVGPQRNYYGNVVIIQHDFLSPEGLPVFTLYGHLQEIRVKTDFIVMQGDEIGTVGDSGIAVGPHLHFEVRVGDGFDFYKTRNPELWIKPYPQFGTLAGRVISRLELPQPGITVLVRANGRNRETYTYGAGDRPKSDPAWQENFTLGDLPVGDYEVLVSNNGNVLFRQTVRITDQHTTFVDIALDG